jgi:hydrogenase maturation protease
MLKITNHGIRRQSSAYLPSGERLQGAGDAPRRKCPWGARHRPAICTGVHEQADNTADSGHCDRLPLKTIIIGLGNPLLTDDALGLKAAARLRQRLPLRDRVEVVDAYLGGLALMEMMVGFERAVVVDAVTTGAHPPGTVVELGLADLTDSRNTASSHDANLALALETGRILGLDLPVEIRFFGLEAANLGSFGENLSAALEAALPALVDRVLASLEPEGIT